MIHPTIGKIVYNETIVHVFYYGDKIMGYVNMNLKYHIDMLK